MVNLSVRATAERIIPNTLNDYFGTKYESKTGWEVKREVEGEVKGEELKEALHPQRVLIRGTYAEPVGEAGGGGEAHLLEQGDGGLVFHTHADIDLVEVEDMAGRVDQSADDGRSIAPAAVFDRHDQSDLRPLVARVEIDEVANAHHLASLVLRHEPDLSVGIDVVAGREDILPQHLAAVGHVGGATVP